MLRNTCLCILDQVHR